jgi:hypothetical protein
LQQGHAVRAPQEPSQLFARTILVDEEHEA